MHSRAFTAPSAVPGGNGQTPSEPGLILNDTKSVVTIGQLLALLERQKYKCAMTGRPITPETAAIDHVVPACHGGTHTIENLQVVHKDVNRAKGTMEIEEFVALCRKVVAWVDGKRDG